MFSKFQLKVRRAHLLIVFVVCLSLFVSTSSVAGAAGLATKHAGGPGFQVNWPQFGFEPSGGRYNPYEYQISVSNVSQLQVAWAATLDNGIFTTPAVANGIVYAGTWGNADFYALDASTGVTLWMQHLSDSSVASPAAANGQVFVGAKYTGDLYAFSAKFGKQNFVVNTGGVFFDHDFTTVANGVIYQADQNGKFFAINATTGAILWTQHSSGFDSGAVVEDGLVYIGSGDGKLYVFDVITGNLKWSASTGGSISSTPAVANGLVYVNSMDGYLYAFFARGCGRQQCFPVWKGSTGSASGQQESSPAVTNGRVYIGSATQNKLLAFNAFGCGHITCRPVWGTATQGIISASPAVANGVVYAAAWDGYIYAFSAKTGKQLWSYNMNGGHIESSPVVVNGMVYVGATATHIVYAFQLPK